jgi:hypothetical protein
VDQVSDEAFENPEEEGPSRIDGCDPEQRSEIDRVYRYAVTHSGDFRKYWYEKKHEFLMDANVAGFGVKLTTEDEVKAKAGRGAKGVCHWEDEMIYISEFGYGVLLHELGHMFWPPESLDNPDKGEELAEKFSDWMGKMASNA